MIHPGDEDYYRRLANDRGEAVARISKERDELRSRLSVAAKELEEAKAWRQRYPDHIIVNELKAVIEKPDTGTWTKTLAESVLEIFASLRAEVEALRGQVPEELFDGYAVLKQIDECRHVSADHVALVLDAVVRLIRARLAGLSPPEQQARPDAGVEPKCQHTPEAFKAWHLGSTDPSSVEGRKCAQGCTANAFPVCDETPMTSAYVSHCMRCGHAIACHKGAAHE